MLTNKKAFTMAEAVTTFFIIGAISLIMFATLKPESTEGGGDLSAKISLSALIEQQNTALIKGENLKNATELTPISSITFTENNSTKSDEVSVIIDGDTLYAATKADDSSCWVLRKNYSITSTEPEVWGVYNVADCGYQNAYNLTIGPNGEGLSKDKPVIG